MDVSRCGSRQPLTPEVLSATIAQARAFIAVQPIVTHGPTVHWLDQGSTRLADVASMPDLQRLWDETLDYAVVRGVAVTDPVDHEATRLFRLALAMAIVAKVDRPAPLPLDR